MSWTWSRCTSQLIGQSNTSSPGQRQNPSERCLPGIGVLADYRVKQIMASSLNGATVYCDRRSSNHLYTTRHKPARINCATRRRCCARALGLDDPSAAVRPRAPTAKSPSCHRPRHCHSSKPFCPAPPSRSQVAPGRPTSIVVQPRRISPRAA